MTIFSCMRLIPLFNYMFSVMQSNPQSNSSPTHMKASQPAVRSQLRNIAPAPSSQKNSSKTLVLKTIPLKVKQVAPTTIKMLPKQPSVRMPQNVVPPQPAEVCLRWNSYHSNMQSSFPTLLDSEEFVDVTLACEGKSVKCHKIILSSCSDYLAALLRENPCQHPIILMKDLKFWEVEALVKFMYKGEVNVAHDKLPQLLNAAEALQVKGLAGPTPPQTQNPPTPISQSRLQTTPAAPKPSEKDSKSFNFSSKSQSSPKRGVKRPMEHKGTRPFTKIRIHHPKLPPSSASSPTIKLEPLDIPLSDTDIFPETNDDSSTTNYDNLITMHEADDPGGDERPDSADGDIQFDFHGSEDITDAEEQMEFVPTDFLEQEHDILEEVDADSSRNSVEEIRDGDLEAETPDDDEKDDDGDGGGGEVEADDDELSKKDET
ncbi:broad-complex core protein isoforms 1/2/3/4/5 [Fopius arisanus]|uniref:Bab2_7 protein n=1 Tax=Fopius arisanus TaxID=64838 RepID=A0A0C9QZF6_9HYME|nr:PREDICTED: broad-complex core protein isoforms 1/2/3/4/5-like [Fopius arisanus]